MKKLILVLFSAIVCFGFCACSSATNDDISSYVGKTYLGMTPWGDEMSISLKSYDQPDSIVTVEETISPQYVAKSECSGHINDENTMILTHGGEFEEDGYHAKYDYSKKIEFKDDTIVITYIDGQATEMNSEGDSGFHQVDALSDDEKTVVLKCK